MGGIVTYQSAEPTDHTSAARVVPVDTAEDLPSRSPSGLGVCTACAPRSWSLRGRALRARARPREQRYDCSFSDNESTRRGLHGVQRHIEKRAMRCKRMQMRGKRMGEGRKLGAGGNRSGPTADSGMQNNKDGRDGLMQVSANRAWAALRRVCCGHGVQARRQQTASKMRTQGGKKNEMALALAARLQQREAEKRVEEQKRAIASGRGQGVAKKEEPGRSSLQTKEEAGQQMREAAVEKEEQLEAMVEAVEKSELVYAQCTENLGDEERRKLEEQVKRSANLLVKEQSAKVGTYFVATRVVQEQLALTRATNGPKDRLRRVEKILSSEEDAEWRFTTLDEQTINLGVVKQTLGGKLQNQTTAALNQVDNPKNWNMATDSGLPGEQMQYGFLAFWKPQGMVDAGAVNIAMTGSMQVQNVPVMVALRLPKAQEVELKFQEQESNRKELASMARVLQVLGYGVAELEEWILKNVQKAVPKALYVRIETVRAGEGGGRLNPFKVGHSFRFGGPNIWVGMPDVEGAEQVRKSPIPLNVVFGAGELVVLCAEAVLGHQPVRSEHPMTKSEARKAIQKWQVEDLHKGQDQALQQMNRIGQEKESALGALQIGKAQQRALSPQVATAIEPALKELMNADGVQEKAALEALIRAVENFTPLMITQSRQMERKEQEIVHLTFTQEGETQLREEILSPPPAGAGVNRNQRGNPEAWRGWLEAALKKTRKITRLEVLVDKRNQVDLGKGVAVLVEKADLWKDSEGGRKSVKFKEGVSATVLWPKEVNADFEEHNIEQVKGRVLAFLEDGNMIFYSSKDFNDVPELGTVTKVSDMVVMSGDFGVRNPADMRFVYQMIGIEEEAADNLPAVLGALRMSKHAVVIEVTEGQMAYGYQPFIKELEKLEGAEWLDAIVYGSMTRDFVIGKLRSAARVRLWKTAACGLWVAGTRFVLSTGEADMEIDGEKEPVIVQEDPVIVHGPNTVEEVLKESPLTMVMRAAEHQAAILASLLEGGGDGVHVGVATAVKGNTIILPYESGILLPTETSKLKPGHGLTWSTVTYDPVVLNLLEEQLRQILAIDGAIIVRNQAPGSSVTVALEMAQAEWGQRKTPLRGTLEDALKDHGLGHGGLGAGMVLAKLVEAGYAVSGSGYKGQDCIILGPIQPIIAGLRLFNFAEVYGKDIDGVLKLVKRSLKAAAYANFEPSRVQLKATLIEARQRALDEALEECALKVKDTPVFIAGLNIQEGPENMTLGVMQELLALVTHPAVVTEEGLLEFWKMEVVFRSVPTGVVMIGEDHDLAEWEASDKRWKAFDHSVSNPFRRLLNGEEGKSPAMQAE